MTMVLEYMNIIRECKRDNIEGSVQLDAEYAQLNPSGTFIQKFYKFITINYNDNTSNSVLHYYGEQGGWHPSNYNCKPDTLKCAKFLKIID